MEFNDTWVGGQGIADVTLEGRRVATGRYRLSSWPTVDDGHQREPFLEDWTLPPRLDGHREVLACETSFYSNTLYTLKLEVRPWGDCAFYAEPIDVVGGRYRIRGTWGGSECTINRSLN